MNNAIIYSQFLIVSQCDKNIWLQLVAGIIEIGALYSPFSFSSFPLLSKKPVVRAFLFNKYARLFGFVVTDPVPSDSERNQRERPYKFPRHTSFTFLQCYSYFAIYLLNQSIVYAFNNKRLCNSFQSGYFKRNLPC